VRVSDFYLAEIERRGYSPLPQQAEGLDALDRCCDEWRNYKARRGGRLSRMLIHPPLPRGVYLWGGVGVGKSFLMDCFFKVVPLERKLRVHFHEFMRGIHREMADLKMVEDPLGEVAERMARRYRLICFDEFHISDIADAMILERLFAALVRARVGFIMTSNYEPDGLYPDGLQREELLPAIELIKSNLEVVGLTSGQDLRRLNEETTDRDAALYQSPLGAKADRGLSTVFRGWVDGPIVERERLKVEGREIASIRTAGSVAWFSFETLCAGPRSQNDYLVLADRYRSILLSDVPKMSSAMASEARRFTWLIDVLYDHGVGLAMSAEAPPDQLYTQGILANEFRRTASRLIEMQSANYFNSERRRTVERLS
jgi:cell division protein ZapE